MQRIIPRLRLRSEEMENSLMSIVQMRFLCGEEVGHTLISILQNTPYSLRDPDTYRIAMPNSVAENIIFHDMQCPRNLVDRFFTRARRYGGWSAIANVVIENRIYWVDFPRESTDLAPTMRIHWLRDETGQMVGEIVHCSEAGPMTKQTYVEVTKMNLMGQGTATRAKWLK